MWMRACGILCSMMFLLAGAALAQQDAGAGTPPQDGAGPPPQESKSLGMKKEKPGAGEEGAVAEAPKPRLKGTKSGEEGNGPKEEAKKDTPPPRQETPVVLDGDIITLKTGTTLSSVQVLKETPLMVVVQIREGVPPLNIPRRQVVSIKYDDIDPNKQPKPLAPSPQASEGDMFKAEELSPEFHRKITAPLSDQVISFKDAYCLQVLEKLGQQAGITLEIGEPAKQAIPKEPVCSFEVKPGTSLLSFIQDLFIGAYPELKAFYPFDKIVMTTKAAAAPSGVPVVPKAPGETAPAPPAPVVPPAASTAPAEGAVEPPETSPAPEGPK